MSASGTIILQKTLQITWLLLTAATATTTPNPRTHNISEYRSFALLRVPHVPLQVSYSYSSKTHRAQGGHQVTRRREMAGSTPKRSARSRLRCHSAEMCKNV
ncbi:hypothetical protein Zmor_000449 [Zophobas morio]|uniref:Secreted protein n=1 Tax=Zophobas morio TaxID=2755281 RepID=A0AA38IZ57_9CUCU|nr:hypothetical protein Zmor_000449 [Zophobas morio]